MVDILTAAIGAKMAAASVQDQIDTALSSVYTYCGQCTNAELASKEKKAGAVWEISDSGTFAAGTDVVCDGTQWNAMAGHLHVNVIDSLDSSSQQDALSANMGKSLATGKQDKLTAGTGISISAENVISAAGGTKTIVESTDWTTFVTDKVVNKELLVVIRTDYYRAYTFTIPKGFRTSLGAPGVSWILPCAGENRISIFEITTGTDMSNNFFNSNASITGLYRSYQVDSNTGLVSYTNNNSYTFTKSASEDDLYGSGKERRVALYQ